MDPLRNRIDFIPIFLTCGIFARAFCARCANCTQARLAIQPPRTPQQDRISAHCGEPPGCRKEFFRWQCCVQPTSSTLRTWESEPCSRRGRMAASLCRLEIPAGRRCQRPAGAIALSARGAGGFRLDAIAWRLQKPRNVGSSHHVCPAATVDQRKSNRRYSSRYCSRRHRTSVSRSRLLRLSR